MELRFIAKDPGSGNGNCPAYYATDGGYVFQGKVIDDETRAQLRDLAGDEDAVFIPEALVELVKRLEA